MTLSAKIGLACAIAAAFAVLAMWIARRVRSSPEKRERNRRLALQDTGRLGDALLTEVQDDTLYYTYKVRGVQYEASQDIASLSGYLPANPDRLIGSVGMKYAPNNPANSILVCEEWSGFRQPRGNPTAAGAISANVDAIRHEAEDSALAQGSQG